MTILAPDLWRKLAGGSLGAETLVARLAAPDVSDRLFAALDVGGTRHFLIQLNDAEIALNDKDSRGIQAETRELAIADNTIKRYIDVRCVDPVGHDVFELVGNELATRLQKNESPAQMVRVVLAKWRRFWGQLPKDLLTKNDQVGLFAELLFLLSWMLPVVNPLQAVRRWRGPMGSRHDFEWRGASVEVKATTSVGSVVHHINGIEQLLPPENGILFLFSLRLREEGGAAMTLPTLVAACRTALASDDEAVSEFELRLLQAGYSPAHEDEYSKLRLRVIAGNLYAVHSDFPRIVPETLLNGVPSGVKCIVYSIDLNGFDHLLVGREVLN